MEQSKSSRKVTVEYTDPSGIYTVISEDLQKRLPLRNLYWNSATRPLRSISSLHIELVQTGSSASSSDPSERVNSVGRHGDAEYAEDRDISRDNRPGSGVGVKKERRHQIPGLRQTPYLKIFFLRCSDVESYRATYRKQIREWIKGNTLPTQSTASVNTQEFHDAFEWLIVHVVLPDDGRSISRASTSKSENRNGLGGSSAVVEKLRADFNGSSKTAVDRVSLVQITRGPQTGQNQVSTDGWEDFIAKTKSLILSSFDLRVTQYEEDIKEREAQMNIPGWNFNTFFVLKEGLARGFESIGLVEDALNGYRELAVGLNTIIEGRDDNEQHREHFKHFTDDLSATLKNALQSEESHNGEDRQTVTTNSVTHDRNARENRHILGANILDADKKPFREMILANEISVFDFQCYLFAREASLLLRLANATVPSDDDGSASGAPSDIPSKAASLESQNLLLLAEVCRQAIEFFSAAGRMIRDDLRSSVHPLSKGHTSGSPTTLTIFDGPIEDIIASWTYSACQCILDATNVLSLQTQLQPLLRSLKPTEEGHAHANNYFGRSTREELPRRTSSLPKSTHASPKPLSPDEFPSITSLDAVRLLPPVSSQTGTQELAAQHAELVVLKRRIMVSVGDRSTDTSIKRAILAGRLSVSASDLEYISLDDTSSQYGRPDGSAKVSHGSAANGIQGIELNQNLGSESSFRQAYEELTVMALALNVLGGRRRSAESLTRDLAVIRYRLQDYISAASYFRQLSSFYYNNDWTRLEVPMLDLYAKCLKHINRWEDFCRIGLQIVAKTTSRPTLPPTSTELQFQNGPYNVDHYLQEVINISRSLERPVSTPLHLHFEGVHLDPYIRHVDEEDGFRMSLQVRNIMSAAVEVQGIRVQLVSIEEEQRRDIWITNQGPDLLQTGLSVIILQSTVTCPAWYRVERIEIRSANIVFTHDATNEASFDGLATSNGIPQLNSTRVLVWPDEKALEARLSLCKFIYLGKPRSIEILVSSGRNKVSHGKLIVRACSAGLRLQTAETDVVSRNCLILQKAQAGNIEFGALDAQSNTIFRVPYSIESDLLKIKVRVEVSYTVEGQAYQYSCIGELPIQLPLSVNVQDSFQERSLFSNFKIDTANSMPMRIGDYRMDSTLVYQVALPPLCSAPLTIFARQPLSLVAKIRQARPETVNTQTSRPPDRMLMLRIKYACVEHEISAAVEDALTEALFKSEFTDLSRLLVTVLGKSLRSSLSLQDLETVGLLGEIQTSSFEQQLWQPVLNGLHPDRREKVAKWLTNWQAENSAIALPQAIDSRNVLELMVPFEIPEIPIVVTGRLETFNCGGGPGEGRFAAMDHSLLAELSLSYSRHWSKSTDVGSESYALNITYEVHASPEIWLIGGQRKGHFSAKSMQPKPAKDIVNRKIEK
ncbi:MAG: hypothetical protein LQ339_007538 [Xanthoria mediterranea]|nr:MAG: hypothetical protein LQ339_007538 [Xanthoria mediterranea]